MSDSHTTTTDGTAPLSRRDALIAGAGLAMTAAAASHAQQQPATSPAPKPASKGGDSRFITTTEGVQISGGLRPIQMRRP